jgi:hypothetical protein
MSKFYFWRDSSQNEVDLLIENGDNLDAYEIKSGKTINQSFFKGLDYLKKINPKTNLSVIYGGFDYQKRTEYTIFPFNEISDIEQL